MKDIVFALIYKLLPVRTGKLNLLSFMVVDHCITEIYWLNSWTTAYNMNVFFSCFIPKVQSGWISDQHCFLFTVPWYPDPKCLSNLETGWAPIDVWHGCCLGTMDSGTGGHWCFVGKEDS